MMVRSRFEVELRPDWLPLKRRPSGRTVRCTVLPRPFGPERALHEASQVATIKDRYKCPRHATELVRNPHLSPRETSASMKSFHGHARLRRNFLAQAFSNFVDAHRQVIHNQKSLSQFGHVRWP